MHTDNGGRDTSNDNIGICGLCGRDPQKLEAEIERLRVPLETLAERSGLELTICGQCGEPIIALMDGMSPMCKACADEAQ